MDRVTPSRSTAESRVDPGLGYAHLALQGRVQGWRAPAGYRGWMRGRRRPATCCMLCAGC